MAHFLKQQKVDSTQNNNTTNNRTVINLSNKELSEDQSRVLGKGLNFAVTPKSVNNLDIIASIEQACRDLDSVSKDEVRFKVKSILDKPNPMKSNISRNEISAISQLKKDNSIKILPADKGNATVILNTNDYITKLVSNLSEDKYDKIPKDPTSSIETKLYYVLRKYNAEISDTVRSKLTPRHSKAPHIYGLPKVHKKDVPLRPIVSSIGSPCYNLAKYLVPIITPLAGKTQTFVKNSEHFVSILKNIRTTANDILVSFDVESLFTNVPIDEALTIIRERLIKDSSLTERTHHSVDCIMELLTICVKTTYFQLDGQFYKQKDGMAMGSPLSPIIANIYMEYFESMAMMEYSPKPTMWLRYVDDTFVIWSHGLQKLSQFHEFLNSRHPSIKFTVEIEKDNQLPFLDVLILRNADGSFSTTVYRKPTHTGLYLNYSSHHHCSTKKTVALSLVNRAKIICSSKALLETEIKHVKGTLKSNGFNNTIIKQAIGHRKNDSKSTDDRRFVSIPYYKGISDKIGKVLRKHNFKVAFKSNGTLRSILSKTKPPSSTFKNCVYSIPCECGREYIGETCRPLNKRVNEHKKKVQNGEVHYSKLAEHAWEHEHRFQWDKARPVIYEENNFKRKLKESAMIALAYKPISQASLELTPLWLGVINSSPNDLTNVVPANPGLTAPDCTRSPAISDAPRRSKPINRDIIIPTHRYLTRYKKSQQT